MKKGKIKFHNRFKGYGIIRELESGEEFHVSPSGMNENMNDGDTVLFEVAEGRGKMLAINIRLNPVVPV